MHETIETLKTRRSCRAYQPRQVEEGALQQVLEAGLYAPQRPGRPAGGLCGGPEPGHPWQSSPG